MEILFGITFSILLMIVGFLYYSLETLKLKNKNLALTNESLSDELISYKTKHSALWLQVKELSSISEDQKNQLESLLAKQETFEFLVGSKVSWVDRTGEEEYGIVYDDFTSGDKRYVVVRRIKNQKLTGGPISINAEKVKVM